MTVSLWKKQEGIWMKAHIEGSQCEDTQWERHGKTEDQRDASIDQGTQRVPANKQILGRSKQGCPYRFCRKHCSASTISKFHSP